MLFIIKRTLLLILCIHSFAIAQVGGEGRMVLLLPYGAGSGPDTVARSLGQAIAANGMPVVVDNKPGASGLIALNVLKGAAAESNSLLMLDSGHLTINPFMNSNQKFDFKEDLVPVAMLYKTSFMFVVSKASPHNNLKDLIEAAKSKPGGLTYGSPFIGSPSQLGSALFELKTKTAMLHLPAPSQQLMLSLIGGDIDWAFLTQGTADSLIASGKLKPLAVAAPQRLSNYPNVPTIEEATGLKNINVGSWVALMAVKGTPRKTVDALNARINLALQAPSMQLTLQKLGFDATVGGPDIVNIAITQDSKLNRETIAATGIKAE
jgi:tripartite-type tricarboxylate transporter receptor subunit TctC